MPCMFGLDRYCQSASAEMTFEIPDYDFDISQNEHPGYALAFAYQGTRDDGGNDHVENKLVWNGF